MDDDEREARSRYRPAARDADERRALLTAGQRGAAQTQRIGHRAMDGFDDPVDVGAVTR